MQYCQCDTMRDINIKYNTSKRGSRTDENTINIENGSNHKTLNEY